MTLVDDLSGVTLQARLDAIGITKLEFAERAGIDRGTLNRALQDDERVTSRTWTKINTQLSRIEDEIGMAESGHLVTSVIEIGDAKVTVQGNASDVAETIRRVIGGEH